MSTTTENKSVVEEFIQALFTRGELDAVEHYLAPDFVNHDPLPSVAPDREGFRETARAFRVAFPDWSSALKELIAEGDLVAERFLAQGTHRGEIMGVAPTGRKVALAGINIFRLKDGKIIERWGRLDDLGFLQQLGVMSQAS